MITRLKKNQIFVFGSNISGFHSAGAALTALNKFGAISCKGEGLMGQSYAFPTLNKNLEQRTERELKKSIYKLYRVVRKNPDKEFLLTKVGCGIAGYPEEFMKSLFKNCPKNIVKPKKWR